MDYMRTYIPACEAFGWSGGPGFNTTLVIMTNGRERRNASWSQPKHRFVLPFQNIDPVAYAGIKQTHLIAMGMARAFLYQDRTDYQASNEVFAVAQAGDTEFQLAKFTTRDGVTFQRKVFALYAPTGSSDGDSVQVTPVITVNGTPAVGWTIDYDRGLVYPPSPMAGGEILRWSGVFSLWVRFNQDDLPFSIDNRTEEGFALNGQVELLEIAAPQPDPVS